MSEEEAIDILQNVICDEVIGTYCVNIQKEGVNCSENCKDEDCYLTQAIENLIKRNKELEEENKRLKYTIKKASKIIDEYTNQTEKDTKKIIEYQKKYLQNKNIQVAYGGRKYNTEGIIIEDYIPKSKLRELINKRGNNGYTSLDCVDDIENLLQEGDK